MQIRRVRSWPAAASGHRVEAKADEDRREVADHSEVRVDDQQGHEDANQYGKVTPSPGRRDVIGEHSYHADQKVADPDITGVDQSFGL